jgi:hypothetical protein
MHGDVRRAMPSPDSKIFSMILLTVWTEERLNN